MKQYIDKSALVAEIERRLEELYNLLPDAGKVENGTITISEACNTGKYTALESFEDYVDTLEVKEVDSELNSFDATVCKIGSTYLKEMDRNAIAKVLEPYKDGDKVKVIIKSKGEQVMTREKLKQGQEIATVLDRINRVLEVESDGNTSEEPRLSFRTSVCGADVQSLAFADFRSDFLKLLFTKKQILEKKFSEL